MRYTFSKSEKQHPRLIWLRFFQLPKQLTAKKAKLPLNIFPLPFLLQSWFNGKWWDT